MEIATCGEDSRILALLVRCYFPLARSSYRLARSYYCLPRSHHRLARSYNHLARTHDRFARSYNRLARSHHRLARSWMYCFIVAESGSDHIVPLTAKVDPLALLYGLMNRSHEKGRDGRSQVPLCFPPKTSIRFYFGAKPERSLRGAMPYDFLTTLF